MECYRCGADLPVKKAPCVFCGLPYRASSPLSLTPLAKSIIGLFCALVLLTLFNTCMGAAAYNPLEFIHREDIGKASAALARGKTREVRSLCAGAYDDAPYSGIPGVFIAASYYRDFMLGDEEALDRMGPYIKEAYKREPNFLSRYYWGLYLYEMGRYQESLDEAKLASRSLIGPSGWGRYVNRPTWQRGFAELIRANEARLKGEGRLEPWYRRIDREPDGPRFEVEFYL